MKLSEIRLMPTVFDTTEHGQTHESMLRSFHIVDKVKELLSANTPAEVILELIDDMRQG